MIRECIKTDFRTQHVVCSDGFSGASLIQSLSAREQSNSLPRTLVVPPSPPPPPQHTFTEFWALLCASLFSGVQPCKLQPFTYFELWTMPSNLCRTTVLSWDSSSLNLNRELRNVAKQRVRSLVGFTLWASLLSGIIVLCCPLINVWK